MSAPKVTAASVRARLAKAGLMVRRKAKGRRAYEGDYTAADSAGFGGPLVDVTTFGQRAHDAAKAALVAAGYEIANEHRPTRPWSESLGGFEVVAAEAMRDALRPGP